MVGGIENEGESMPRTRKSRPPSLKAKVELETLDPPIFVVRIKLINGNSQETVLPDEALANRIAAAMRHAATLCGAPGDREPF